MGDLSAHSVVALVIVLHTLVRRW